MYTKSSASALTKTLKAFQAVMLAMTLVTLSLPVTPVRAEGEEPTTPVVETPAEAPAPAAPTAEDCEAQGKVLNDAGDACVDAPAPALDCEATGQVLNEAGDACVDPEPAPEDGDSAPQSFAKFSVEQDTPEAPYEDNDDDGQCVLVSNTLTDGPDGAAVLVSEPHNSRWTATLDSIAKWIWGEDPVDFNSGTTEVETFTRTFSIDDDATGASLEIAADNGYSVKLDGNLLSSDCTDMSDGPEGSHNYQQTDTCTVGALDAGEHTLEFTVTNYDQANETQSSNPAGLRYKLTVEGADCGEPKKIENSCLAPSAGGASEHVTVNGAPGSEDDLADLIGSSDVDDDQVNFQTWDATGNDVDFVVTYHGKKANSGDKHLWGWFNGTTFTPIFRDAATGNVTYDALPLLNTEGQQTTFSVTGVTDISFGIYDVSSGKYYSTDKANGLNGDSSDHAVVYNPNDDEYTIGYEDLPNGGDHDFEDVVVGLTTECSPTDDTATIVATKIVCSDEKYLPDAMGSSHVTDEDTAADFLDEVNADYPNDPVCWLQPDWHFEWGNQSAGDAGGDYVGHADGYNTSGATGEDGTVTMSVPLDGVSEIHVRELLQDGYIPFTYDQENPSDSNTESAELSCSNDGLHYDNYDFIRNPEEGEKYYCVAWNVEEPKAPVCDPGVNLVANGDFEATSITNAANWDIFQVGTTPALAWAAAFLDAGGLIPGNVELQKIWADSDLNGATGDQYAELDSDWGGPSSSQSGEAGSVEISQNLTTVPGQKYHVSYDFSARPGTAATQNSVSVKIDGSSMHITTAGAPTAGNQTEWSTDGFDFTASGASTLLALSDAGSPNDSLGTFVDNVKVTCVPDEEELPVCNDDQDNDGDDLTDANDPGCWTIPGDPESYDPNGDSEEDDICPNHEGVQHEVPSGEVINNDGQCVADETSTPDDTNKKSRNGHSGGGGGNFQGEVLGATTCGPLLTQYLKQGWANSPDEVTKLQQFLNDQLELSLPLSGFFGPATFEAVKAFQLKYGNDVLIPWVGLPASGITGDNTPTGFVYQTTRWKINNLFCPGSEAFPAALN